MLIILAKICLINMNADIRNCTNNLRIHPYQQNVKGFLVLLIHNKSSSGMACARNLYMNVNDFIISTYFLKDFKYKLIKSS